MKDLLPEVINDLMIVILRLQDFVAGRTDHVWASDLQAALDRCPDDIVHLLVDAVYLPVSTEPVATERLFKLFTATATCRDGALPPLLKPETPLQLVGPSRPTE